jgi:hypothetical protein
VPSPYTGNLLNVSNSLFAEVTGASNASPIEITTASPHFYANGDQVIILFASGNTAANSPPNFPWTITVIDATHFTLNNSVGNGVFTGTAYAFDVSLTPPFNIPSDGDTFNAAAFNVAFQALADRTQFLNQAIEPGAYSLIQTLFTEVGDVGGWAQWASKTATGSTYTDITGTTFLTGYGPGIPAPVCNSGDVLVATFSTTATASLANAPVGIAAQYQPVGTQYTYQTGNAFQLPNNYSGPLTLQTFQAPSYASIFGTITAYDGVAHKLTLGGFSGLTSNVVGAYVTIIGASNAGNNGTFMITDWISSSSVKVLNTSGVYPDGNSGALEFFVDAFTFNFDIQIKGSGGTQPFISFNGEHQFVIQQYRPNHRYFL